MTDSINDVVKQARQGSVAAIIQVLNDKLADSGVRTRAMFSGGALQLLCEAPKVEQLEQPVLVDRIRQILESIGPRNVRRVNVNSRIVREQQLLWLEEINRDPENQLLWSEEIVLAKPSFLKRMQQLSKDWQSKETHPSRTTLPKSASNETKRERRQFWRGLLGGASFSVLLVLLGWAAYEWLEPQWGDRLPISTGEVGDRETDTEPSPIPAAPASPEPDSGESVSVPAQPQDPFVQAVRIAERAAMDGQNAETPADWLDLATRWQRASDLMEQVPSGDGRYSTAQDRITVYRQNSEAALQEAQSQQSP